MIRLSIAILGIMLLSGCTLTGEPRSENVVFNEEGYIVATETLKNSIAVGEVSDFPGTSNFTYSGRLAPNFSNESFKETLQNSLDNAELKGSTYILNAKLIDGGDWSEWTSIGLGKKRRPIEINYTLKEDSGENLFSQTIKSEVTVANYNPLRPFYLFQREAAEKSYAENIRILIEELSKL